VQKDAAANQCLTIKIYRSCVATQHQKRVGLGLYSIQHVALGGEHGSSDHVGEGIGPIWICPGIPAVTLDRPKRCA